MKKRLSTPVALILGIVIGSVLFGGSAAIAASVMANDSTWKIFVDGKAADISAYSINGSNYLGMREVCEAVDVGLWYDGVKREVYIERDKGYDPSYTGPGNAVAPRPSAPATIGETNALESALSYLDVLAFSRQGLIKQLEYGGYTNSEAVYAVDHCDADWNEQAAKSAENYLEIMSFSRQGLIEQLEYDGFTHSEAVYGAEAMGY